MSSFLALVGWPWLNFTWGFSISSPPGAQADGERVLQSVHQMSLTLLPPQGEDPSHSFPAWALCAGWSSLQTAPVWIPSMWGSPSGTCSKYGFPQGHSLLWAPAFSGVGSSTGCRQILLRQGSSWAGGAPLPQHGLPHRLQVNLCSGTRGTFSPSFTDLDVCRSASITDPHSSLAAIALCGNNFPLLNKLAQRCCHCHWWTHPAAGPSLRKLDMGNLLAASTKAIHHQSFSSQTPQPSFLTFILP